MHDRNVLANFDVSQIFIDSLLIFGSFLFTQHIYAAFRGFYVDMSHLWMYIIFNLIFVMCMWIFRMYNITTFFYLDRIIRHVMVSAIIACACICAVVFLSQYKSASRFIFLMFSWISFSTTLVFRVLVRWMRGAKVGNGYTHILFIGSARTCWEYQRFIGKTAIRVKIDRCVDFDNPALQSDAAFEELLVELAVREVVIVQDICHTTQRDLNPLLQVCEDMGITVRVLLDSYNMQESKCFVSSIGTFPMLTYHSTSFDSVQLFVKSIIDIVGASVGLLLLSPIFLITAIAIRLESPGPALFKQTRVGRNGKCFKIYKFRSMYQDAEARKAELMAQNKISSGLMFKIDNDPRVTKVGKFIRKTSIDELPQLINVLRRDMSLVGTRPPTVDEVAKYNRYHRRRISIMPGITGMWQVNGRSNILDFEEVVELDKQYIAQWSIALDIKLLFKTVSAVMTRRGAS